MIYNYLIFIFFQIILFKNVFSNTVSVVLDSKWPNSPFIAEAGEYFASKSIETFWDYINQLNLIKDNLSLDNSEIENHAIITKVAKKLLTTGEVAILQLSLSLRSYSPSVEMNHQLDKDVECGESSMAFVKIGKHVVCHMDNIEKTVESDLKEDNETKNVTGLYKTDKIFPLVDSISSIPKSAVIIVLYGDLRDSQFYNWHEKVLKQAAKPDVFYVFRHRIKNRNGRTRLSGYGVELAIKSTEYKAVDDSQNLNGEDSAAGTVTDNSTNTEDEVQGFIFSQLKELHQSASQNLDAFRRHLLTTDSTEIRPLKAWQIQELSLQAAQFIMNSLETNQALQVLRDVSQNYPVRAHFLANSVQVNPNFRRQLQNNQKTLEEKYGLQPGQAMVLFNGYLLSQDLDMFEIVDLARREMAIMTRLYDFGLQSDHISAITTVEHSPEASSMSGTNGGGKVQFLLDIRAAPVSYINNLEKDTRYAAWPRSVRDLLTPAYPGVMRRVAKNLFNVILVLDPALPTSWEYVRFAEAFIIHNAPIRMGFVWTIDPSADMDKSVGRALVRAFNFVSSEKDDAMSGLSFITDFYGSVEDNEKVTVKDVKSLLKDKHPDVDMDMVFGEKSDYDDNIKASWKYLHDSGIQHLTKPLLLINGQMIDSKTLAEQGFEETVVNSVLLSTVEMQKMAMENLLSDAFPVLDVLMVSDNVVTRLNERILENKNRRYLTFTKSHPKKIDVFTEAILKTSNDNITTILADRLKYFVKNDDPKDPQAVSIWCVADMTSRMGRSVVREALKWIQGSYNSRVAIVPSPAQVHRDSPVQKALHTILRRLTSAQAKLALAAMLVDDQSDEAVIRASLDSFLEKNPEIKTALGDYMTVPADYMLLEETFVRDVLKVEPGVTLLIANGKIIGPFSDQDSLVKDDFKLVERSCLGGWKLLRRLRELLGSGASKSVRLSQLTMLVHATLMRDQQQSTKNSQVGVVSATKKIELSGIFSNAAVDEHASFTLMGHSGKPAFELVAVIDPLTRTAQKLSHILLSLKEALNLNVRIVFNCRDKLSEQPLKSFYRFVLEPHPVVESDLDNGRNSASLASPRALFTRLPGAPLLTLGVEPIHSWLVEATRSQHDLDNIRFADMASSTTGGAGSIQAQFELEYLLLEGHCVDVGTGQPPRGLQFELATPDGRPAHDTIVMANLGYFQLKANPGAWNLRLREGKSKNIYDVVDHEYTDSEDNSQEVMAVIDSFRSKIIRIKVNKKPGKLNEQLLSESKLDEDTSSIWESISNAFTKSSGSEVNNETINIFSVASGHLYERFLRIMMLSVLKNTKSKVKFWFLKNYLSPTFKQFIPHMAAKYGFEYDLVQYKWPRWLHEQTEKQRLIWGYKILFLDVLFPLNVSKIIFVDADQMVRADMKELVDLDLEGAPYGYTPFCSSRTEMDGFRFWKTGYWSMHLAGRPYHISALYVVDLQRFRQMAAGDRLRGQYHGLSQDPNSLSNLDQDLPNNMIHQVPIKSLPQEWLWCETWCSDTEKARAKTIDLCNNPQTKEPKLSAAMRILPEWKHYDEEIKTLWTQVYPAKASSPNEHASTLPPQKATIGDKDVFSVDKKDEL